jgi:hypothetical protein
MTPPSGISNASGIHAEMPSGVSVDVRQLAPRTVIDVETKSRTYRLECLGGKSVLIAGHPDYCPTPTPAQVHGSVSKSGGLEFGRIEKGSRLMFFLNGDQPVTTSSIVSVRVSRAPTVNPSSSGGIQ